MLTPDKWTVVAHSLENTERDWSWVQGFSPKQVLQDAADDKVILMHRKDKIGGVQLVARLAGAEWRKMQAKGRGR